MSIQFQDAIAYRNGTNKKGFVHNPSEACLRRYDLESNTELVRYRDALGEHEMLTKPMIRCSVMIPVEAWSYKNRLISEWLKDCRSTKEEEKLLDRFCNCLIYKLHSKSNTLNLWSVENISQKVVLLTYDTDNIDVTVREFLSIIFGFVCNVLKSIEDSKGNKVLFNEKCINIRATNIEFSPYIIDVKSNQIVKQSEFCEFKDSYRF